MEKNDRKNALSPNASSTKQRKSSQSSIRRHQKQDLTWKYVSESTDSRGKKVIACDFCENEEKTKDKMVVDLEMEDYEVIDGQSSHQSCTSLSRKRKVSMYISSNIHILL
ncbi:unnamed protein product [Arabis nemorensis]|uniref:BED-type domain-containing protein n=1 Tax=Arabis nemorensis TaxID=586526 RepID=A0A565BUE3_9BRAS|nr:unnamed protein product [Arabis nemorensis]